ncbi:hypothetical protein G6F65_021037 [Rhizopus arrhizus]|nr:hypothetical protein G6F65_021037 [Rhizopus arrhizus]
MGAPRGALSITAPAFFGELHVMPAVLGYLRAHREVSVRTLLVDRVVNLLDEGVDVAVRIGALPDSTLTAVPVGQVRRVVCDAPAFLQEHGEPKDLDALPLALPAGRPSPAAERGFAIDGHVIPGRGPGGLRRVGPDASGVVSGGPAFGQRRLAGGAARLRTASHAGARGVSRGPKKIVESAQFRPFLRG